LMLSFSRSKTSASCLAVALLFVLSVASNGAAQSGDPNFPAPVFSNEVTGRIAPRDIGDARRTRHFYTFRGMEGDVLVTLDSSDLIGDVDVFIANGLRPLLKITLFNDAVHVSKSFYLRKEETLILRIEARAVGDTDGTYRINFGGSFAPAPTDITNTLPPEAPTVSSAGGRGKNVRRVTSTGARIEEPPAPAPTPSEVANEPVAQPSPTPAAEPDERKPAPAPRRNRGARTSTSRTRASTAKPKPATTDTAKTETAETKPDADAGQPTVDKPETEKPTTTPAKKPPAPRRRNTRAKNSRSESARTETTATSAQPSTEAQPATEATEAQPTQRLVIFTKNGEMIERNMSDVRRVTVENNQLVVVTKDGKIMRKPMGDVLRMSIEP
jgi:hypothetical protein